VLAGLVPEGTPRKSSEYVAAYKQLLRDFYLDHAALILEVPREELESVQMPYGPKMFSLVERMGTDARVAANGVVAGDTFGNGHFLTSGGAITGMVGHACRIFFYWHDIDSGKPSDMAVRALADAIKEDTLGWLHVSAQEFSQALPINFGQERIAAIEAKSGTDSSDRANTIDATRRHRKSLLPLDPSDWRRLTIRAGRLHVPEIPPLQESHPAERDCPVLAGDSDFGGAPGGVHGGARHLPRSFADDMPTMKMPRIGIPTIDTPTNEMTTEMARLDLRIDMASNT
jgi:hypothetical protein